MTPERMAELVVRWVRLYTRSLPAPVAERRAEEIDADLHDHIAHERIHGTPDQRIALSILSRMVRGLAADAAWRGEHARTRPSSTNGAMSHLASRPIAAVLLATAGILLVQAAAMLLTDAVAWGPVDFVLAGALLAGTGLAAVAASRMGGTAYRAAAAVALAAALMLVVSVLAVGVIAETGDPADLMYAGVLAVGIGGTFLARLRPQGMARALLAMAGAQALVAAIALLAGKHQDAASSVAEILSTNAAFVALFAASAWLFRRAAQASPPQGRGASAGDVAGSRA